MTRQLRITLALVLLVITIAVSRVAAGFGDEEVIFYPTYGFKQGTDWIIPMRAKVQEPRSAELMFDALFRHLPSRDASETSRFKARIADFVADDESGEDVRVQYEGDSEHKEYRIADAKGRFPETDANGMVEGTLTLPDAVAQRLLTQQGSTGGWLSYRAVSADHTGTGRVRLIGPTGVSVISDIDDTIKVTEIPAGIQVVLTNTLYRDFAPTTELRGKYESGGDVAFHYVSGGPWQLYRPLATFLIGGRHFPEGSFHMKTLAASIRKPVTSVEHLARFVMPDGTFQHKVTEITRIMERFPGRRFVLIGDSGEMDPEVYRQVQSQFQTQIQEIIIRDLTNARQLQPNRLTGMTIVEARTVTLGMSQLSR